MKQKFTFTIDSAKGLLKLAEAGEIDLGTFQIVHEESYDLQEMRTAAEQGQAAFIEKMRKRNLFPPFDLAVKLFESAKDYLKEDSDVARENCVVEYDDIEAFPMLEVETAIEDEDEEEVVEIDELLKDDPEDLSEDDIKEIDSDDDTPKFLPEDNSEHEN